MRRRHRHGQLWLWRCYVFSTGQKCCYSETTVKRWQVKKQFKGGPFCCHLPPSFQTPRANLLHRFVHSTQLSNNVSRPTKRIIQKSQDLWITTAARQDSRTDWIIWFCVGILPLLKYLLHHHLLRMFQMNKWFPGHRNILWEENFYLIICHSWPISQVVLKWSVKTEEDIAGASRWLTRIERLPSFWP